MGGGGEEKGGEGEGKWGGGRGGRIGMGRGKYGRKTIVERHDLLQNPICFPKREEDPIMDVKVTILQLCFQNS